MMSSRVKTPSLYNTDKHAISHESEAIKLGKQQLATLAAFHDTFKSIHIKVVGGDKEHQFFLW